MKIFLSHNVFSTYVREWYKGNLQNIIFHPSTRAEIKAQICAFLTRYVWDETNFFVKKYSQLIKNMASLIEMEEKQVNV
jgi:hypothetical protein